MPKEVVKTSGYTVVLGWGSGGCVQLATEVPEPQQDSQPNTLLEEVSSWAPETQECARGLYASLNRDDINRLIRSLRKARDSTYGRDE